LLKNAGAIRLLLSLLKHSLLPQDSLTRGESTLLLWQLQDQLTKPVFAQETANYSLHALLLQAQKSSEQFYQMLNPKLHQCLKQRNSALLHLVNELIAALGMQHLQSEYLQRFTEIVYQYEIDHESDLAAFIEWWHDTENSHCIKSPDNENAVVVLTIHRAKGLQYPVVLMPYAKRALKTRSENIMWLPNQSFSSDWLDYIPLNFSENLTKTSYGEAYFEETELALVDALNILYVAFTRAEDRLYVLATPKENPLPNTASLLYNYIKDNNELNSYFNDEVLQFGSEVAPEKKVVPNEKPAATSLAKTVDNLPALRKPRLSIADLRAPKVKPFQSGIVLHNLLALFHKDSNRQNCLQTAVNLNLITESERNIWQSKVDEILELETIKTWNEQSIWQLNEQEFVTREGNLRPDKIYLLPDRIVVLDYKTGKPNEEHHTQVRAYKEVVASLKSYINTGNNPNKNIEIDAYLLYTQSLELIKVD
ncbi:hypothetical protein GC194_01990, partial [bacterium]|nr:hypothetical protein [bacterium]